MVTAGEKLALGSLQEAERSLRRHSPFNTGDFERQRKHDVAVTIEFNPPLLDQFAPFSAQAESR